MMSLTSAAPFTSNLTTSRLCLGSWHTYDRMRFDIAIDLVRTAIDEGVNFFDVGIYESAAGKVREGNYYGDVLLAHALRAAGIWRHEYVVTTKLWLETAYLGQSLTEQIQRNFRRLATDHTEIAVVGAIRDEQFQMPEFVAQVGALLSAGLVTAGWGVCNWSVARIREAVSESERQGVPGPRILQVSYSIADRTPVEDPAVADLVADTRIELQAASAMGGGLMVGNPTQSRKVQSDNLGNRAEVVGVGEKLASIAELVQATPAQLALAFSLTGPGIESVVFGCTRVGQLRDNLAAHDLLERLGPLAVRDAVVGLWDASAAPHYGVEDKL